MTTALEERVDRLEQRVKQLETWAGLGQNGGFSANLVEIRKSLAEQPERPERPAEQPSRM